MWRSLRLAVLLVLSAGLWAQGSPAGTTPSSPASSSPPRNTYPKNGPAQNSPTQNSASSGTDSPADSAPAPPEFSPPRSDSVDVNDLGPATGESSSKDTQADIDAPSNDAAAHPKSAEMLEDAGSGSKGSGDVDEFHPWDPHKAAKDVEIGDFYFKRKNYKAAEDRYREALYYKNNDAIATYRLAICLEKLGLPNDARTVYENYLKILPHGPEAEEVQKALTRLSGPSAATKPVN